MEPHQNLTGTMKINGEVRLTKREHEVFEQLAKGMSREEIATELFISAETVKMHIKNSYKKLRARNKIDALVKMKMI